MDIEILVVKQGKTKNQDGQNKRQSIKKENIMKAKNCCKTMEMELTGWKAIIYDITRKMEKLSGGERLKILPNVEDLHMLIEELDARIEYIRENCKPETGMEDIQAERAKFNSGISSLRMSAEEAMQGLGGGNFGG